jgi:triosephosphate isomerase (TIM)
MILAGKKMYLVANWKSHKTLEEARDFIDGYTVSSNHTVIICPPMPYVVPLKEAASHKGFALGAQDVSNYPFGAYTGAVSAVMLKKLVDYVIVGHSERRTYFGETNDMVASKVKQSIEADIIPILCVDEPYMEPQLAFFEPEEFKKMIIAYEPVSAIGTGQPDTPEHAEAVAAKIMQLTQIEVPVIYGGSVSAITVRSFIEQPSISGVLVGGASLKLDDWQAIVQAVV